MPVHNDNIINKLAERSHHHHLPGRLTVATIVIVEVNEMEMSFDFASRHSLANSGNVHVCSRLGTTVFDTSNQIRWFVYDGGSASPSPCTWNATDGPCGRDP